ncbi:MAG: inorganic phosphate transporter [Chloroflexi bacterium]|nr:inorganic phosphate transporter [Chloroflexota bacterium]
MLFAIVIAALIFGFLNGIHDSSNIVATAISSRALPPRVALFLTALAESAGPFLFGVAVATTVGKGLIDPTAITPGVVLGAVLAAIAWNLITWFLGIPSSSSHALVGGLLGAAVMARGLKVIQAAGLWKVLIALFVSPPLGLLVGFLIMRLVLFLAAGAPPRVSELFKHLQVVTAIGLALSHGANDAQKTMGIITLGLVAAGVLTTFVIPLWVIAASAMAIALGTALGGWRLIRTLGGRIYKIRPIHGFTSQTASAAVILGAALLGGPVSTTQVVSSAIMGAGAAERMSKVRWSVAQEMLIAWGLTIPVTAAIAALVYLPIKRIV